MISATISAVIADDEPLARERVRQMLETHQDIALAGECATAAELLVLVRETAPALLLLDIRLAGGSGMTSLAEIPASSRPAVIFLTAYPEFALQAFDLAAADYLVKPFDQRRFDRALDRARRLIRTQSSDAEPSHDVHRATRPRERFAVKRRGEIIFVKAMDIDWIGAEGNYSRLHTGGGAHLVRESLQSIADALDPSTFIRVHRSAVVNVDRVVKLVSHDDRGTFIVLSTGDKVPIGPTYRSRLEELFGAE
jgi:two-component system LytT family response regulator